MKSLVRDLEILVAVMLAILFFIPLVAVFVVNLLHHGQY